MRKGIMENLVADFQEHGEQIEKALDAVDAVGRSRPAEALSCDDGFVAIEPRKAAIVDAAVALRGYRGAMICGERGSGKTTTLAHIARRLIGSSDQVVVVRWFFDNHALASSTAANCLNRSGFVESDGRRGIYVLKGDCSGSALHLQVSNAPVRIPDTVGPVLEFNIADDIDLARGPFYESLRNPCQALFVSGKSNISLAGHAEGIQCLYLPTSEDMQEAIRQSEVE